MSESDFIDCVTLAQPDAINAVEQCGDAKEIYAEMILGGRPVRFHIDCGATVNVLPAKYVESKEIKSTKKVLQMWNKSELKPEGVTRVTIGNPKNNKKYSVEFVVVKEELTPLLGAKASQHMGLLEIHPENFRQVANVKMPQSSETARAKTADQLIKEYHDVFEGDLGTLPGTQRLEVDPSVTPTISPSRRVPLALKPRLKQELERLTSLRVIAPVDSPTDWVSNVVVATKPSGDLRICIDLKGSERAQQSSQARKISNPSDRRRAARALEGQSLHEIRCSKRLLACSAQRKVSQTHNVRHPVRTLLLAKTTLRSQCVLRNFPETNPPSLRRITWLT